MYNGRFKSYTYGADGQLAINSEKQWGDSIVNNNAEHFAVQSKIQNLKNISNQSKSQIEYFQSQNEKQSRQIEFLTQKYNVFNNISKAQENFYSDLIQEQYLNYNDLSNHQEKFCNSTINKQYNHLSQQQNLLQQQQRALEYFQNINQSQANSNYNIHKKHLELSRNNQEYFTEDIHHDPPVYKDSVSSKLDLSTITNAPGSSNATPTIISNDEEPEPIIDDENTISNNNKSNQNACNKKPSKYSTKSMTNYIKTKASSLKDKTSSIKNNSNFFSNKSKTNGYSSDFCGDNNYEGIPIFKCGLDLIKSMSTAEKLEDISKNLHNFKTEKEIADYCKKNEFCRGYTPELVLGQSNGVLQKQWQPIMDIPDKDCNAYEKEWKDAKSPVYGWKYQLKGYCKKKNVDNNKYPSNFCGDNQFESVPIFKNMADIEKSIRNSQYQNEKEAIAYCDKDEFCIGYFPYNLSDKNDVKWAVLADVPDKNLDEKKKTANENPSFYNQVFKGYCRKK